jgi:hypothetical protein
MKANLVKIVGSTIGLLALGSICIIGVRAQQSTAGTCVPSPVKRVGIGSVGSGSVSTNWVGCLVAGRTDTMDKITPGPFPKIFGQVEIGLRSDGVVIWRAAPKAN